jgi:hypothetical protein
MRRASSRPACDPGHVSYHDRRGRGRTRVTRQSCQRGARWRRAHAGYRVPECAPTARRAYQSKQHPNGSRFPCSIWSEETKDGALIDRQIQRIDGAVPTKVFGEPLCFDGKCLWLHSCTSSATGVCCSWFTRWQRWVPTNNRPAIAAILMGRFTGDLGLVALPPETSLLLCVGARGSPALP